MDIVFPPSPQWHQPHSACLVSRSGDSGWLVYSHNNTIQILNPFTLKHQGVLRGSHTAKINAVAARTLRLSIDSNTEKISKSDDVRDMAGIDNILASTTSSSYSSPVSSGSVLSIEDVLLPDAGQRKDEQNDTSTAQKDGALIATVGEDMRVVCWNLDTQRAIASHAKVHSKVIKAVEWTGDGQLVVSGDKGGVIVIWDPFQDKRTLKFELPTKPSISCMSSSPTHADIVAIGMDGGDIFMCKISLTGVSVQQRLHGHTERIHSLAWQPPTLHSNEYTPLASGSGDQTVRVWDVVSETSSVVLKVPDLDDKLSHSQKTRFWVPVGWVSQGQRLMSATSRIIAWDIDNGQGLAQIECIGGNVYALDISVIDPGRIAISLGNETLKIWNTLSKDEPYECLTIDRLNTRARSVRWHPIEEGTLGFGLESGKIGMLTQTHESFTADGRNANNSGRNRKGRKKGHNDKQTSSGPTQIIFHSYHEKPVTSMAWCSSKVFEAPIPELFDLALRDGSFCLVSCGGEGKILVSDPSKPLNKSLDLDVVIQKQNATWYEAFREIKGIGRPERRDFAIHPNEDLLAIGNADGSVEVFELKYFKLVYVYQSHRSRVNRLSWSKHGIESSGDLVESAVGDSSGVKYLYLLASGSDEGVVAIHDLSQFSGSAMEEKRAKKKKAQITTETLLDESCAPSSAIMGSGAEVILPTSQVMASFHYHRKGISDLAWSPHGPIQSGESNHQYLRIVTTSYDGKAVVVEIRLPDSPLEPTLISQMSTSDGSGSSMTSNATMRQYRAIASYTDHEDQVLSVAWSLTDVDRIYSGGNDWGLCSWDLKSHLLTEAQSLAFGKGGGDGSRKHTKALDNSKGTSKSQSNSSINGQIASTDDIHDQNESKSALQVSLSTPDGVSMDVDIHQTESVFAPEEIQNEKEESVTSKRTSESSPHPEVTPTKRSRTSSSNNNYSSMTSTTTTAATTPTSTMPTYTQKLSTPTKRFQLFPMGAAAFQGFSNHKTHLEIIRLTRNLYCRRISQGGVLRTEEELDAARSRWRAMRAFFEEDGEEEGKALSKALGLDLDEMNLEDEDMAHSNQQIHTIGTAIDDTSASSGDLVFYGSRESIKALAEMEAEEMAHLHPQNIFVVGSGMGVMPPASASLKESITQTKNGTRTRAAGQLCQVPVAAWLGDVPKVMDIVGSLSASEVGVQDWIAIALAPMGGVEAWKEMMIRTGGKFEARGEIHAAGLCYLAAGRIYDAVDVYRKQGLFREALTLLRIRLWDYPGDDMDDNDDKEKGNDDNNIEKILDEDRGEEREESSKKKPPSANDFWQLHIRILTEWGQQLERRNQYEQACKCQLTLGSLLRVRSVKSSTGTSHSPKPLSSTVAPSVGLQTLARRGDVATLRTVAGLAILMNDPTVQESIACYRNALLLKKQALESRRSQV
ncbi:Gem-associated protein 5 [Linnemannia zychae]|nr:Gem-associated protein 5 [Linnemannia zychae]